jgi:hypothetical protein
MLWESRKPGLNREPLKSNWSTDLLKSQSVAFKKMMIRNAESSMDEKRAGSFDQFGSSDPRIPTGFCKSQFSEQVILG